MTSHSFKEVVLCADDYALNAPVSQGIVALAVLGRLSATSVMSLSPRWAEDVVALRDVRERLDVGVHLDWTSSFAVHAGHGRGLVGVQLLAKLRLCKQKTIEGQIERQLDAFEDHWHTPPDHVDSHHQVHQLPVFREALVAVLMRRYGKATQRPWLRASVTSSLEKLAMDSGWPSIAPEMQVYSFAASLDAYARHMQDRLMRLPDQKAALLTCNPAVSAQGDDRFGSSRKCEFAYLAGHDFVQHLLDARVRLVRGSGKSMLTD